MCSDMFEKERIEEDNETQWETVGPCENACDKHSRVFVVGEKVKAAGCKEPKRISKFYNFFAQNR